MGQQKSQPVRHTCIYSVRQSLTGFSYWEAKLPANYQPDDSKIENFIRTKYDMKKWVLSRQIPDPATLDGEQAAAAAPAATKPSQPQPPRPQPSRATDLLGGDNSNADNLKAAPTTAISGRQTNVPSRYNNHSRPSAPNRDKPTPTLPQQAPPQQQQQPSASLIGLDFGSFSSPSPAATSNNAPAPSATASAPSAAPAAQNTRPDLKKSILSLYASAPAPKPVYHQPVQQQQQQQQQSFATSNAGLDSTFSSFGNLNLNQASAPQTNTFSAAPAKQSNAFDDLLSGSSGWDTSQLQTQKKPASTANTFGNNFASPMQSTPSAAASSNEWSDFTSGSTSTPASSSKPVDDVFSNVWK